MEEQISMLETRLAKLEMSSGDALKLSSAEKAVQEYQLYVLDKLKNIREELLKGL